MNRERLDLTEKHTPCRDADPEIFFPIGEISRSDKEQIKEAKAICNSCPAQEACLSVALKRPEEFGIWGGLTEYERKALKRRNERAKSFKSPRADM